MKTKKSRRALTRAAQKTFKSCKDNIVFYASCKRRAEEIIAPLLRTASRSGVELEQAGAKVMPFGKHRGKLDQVPKSYLQWCLRECSNWSLSLRDAIRLVLSKEDGA